MWFGAGQSPTLLYLTCSRIRNDDLLVTPGTIFNFMDYDLGFFDNEVNRVEPVGENPFAQKCSPCLRYELLPMSPGWIRGRSEAALAANILHKMPADPHIPGGLVFALFQGYL